MVQLLILIGYSASKNPAAEITFSELFLLPGFVIAAAFVEESFKYLIISKRIETYSLEKSFVVNSLFVGLGFAVAEFLLLFSSAALPDRQILTELAIIHVGIAGIIGYLVAIKNPKKFSSFLHIVMLATILHSSYNFLVQKRDFFQNYLILLLLGFVIVANIFNILRIRRKLAQD